MCIGIRILLAFQFSKVQGYSKRVGIPFKSAATITAATFFPCLVDERVLPGHFHESLTKIDAAAELAAAAEFCIASAAFGV